MKIFFALIASIALLTSCNNQKQEPTHENQMPEMGMGILSHKVEVVEIIQATSYTYLKVTENDFAYWIAISKQDAKVGDILYYTQALEMKNFESKDLNRTFDRILFVQSVSSTSIANQMDNANKEIAGHKGKKNTEFNADIKIVPTGGSITIADLCSNRRNYAGKIIKVKGQVVKVNNGIMGKNWIHIQDGTKTDDEFDLTITSQQTAEIGEVITIEGILALDKDFGAGYLYNLIAEDCSISK